jgi:hypothetical protein
MTRLRTVEDCNDPNARLVGDGALGPTAASVANLSWPSFWCSGIPFGVLGILPGWALHSRYTANSQRFWF